MIRLYLQDYSPSHWPSFNEYISGIVVQFSESPAISAIIESRTPFAVERRRGVRRRRSRGRKKKMADGAAYTNNSRLARSRRVRLHVLLLSLSRFPPSRFLPPVCPTCHGQFLSRRICLSLPIVKAPRAGLWSPREKTRGRTVVGAKSTGPRRKNRIPSAE